MELVKTKFGVPLQPPREELGLSVFERKVYRKTKTIAGRSMHKIAGGHHLESLKHLAVARSSFRGILRSSKSGASEEISPAIAEVSSSGIVGYHLGPLQEYRLGLLGNGPLGLPGYDRLESPERHRLRSTELTAGDRQKYGRLQRRCVGSTAHRFLWPPTSHRLGSPQHQGYRLVSFEDTDTT